MSFAVPEPTLRPTGHTTLIANDNRSQSSTPIAWPKPASCLRSAASATAPTACRRRAGRDALAEIVTRLHKVEVIWHKGPWHSF